MPVLKIAHKGQGLCVTCQHGRTTTYDNDVVETVCSASPYASVQIQRPVVRCTDYIPEGKASKYDMEKIAWMLRTDKRGHAIGFVPPKPDDTEK